MDEWLDVLDPTKMQMNGCMSLTCPLSCNCDAICSLGVGGWGVDGHLQSAVGLFLAARYFGQRGLLVLEYFCT